jgi:hypothetical protein
MRIRRFALAVAGLSLVTGAVAATSATAEVQGKPQPNRQLLAQGLVQPKAAAAGACLVDVGAVTAAGQNGGYQITATKPVTAKPFVSYKLFATRASSTWHAWKGSGTTNYYAGFVLVSGSLYTTVESYKTPTSAPVVSSKRLGTGWSSFSALASSRAINSAGNVDHMFLYGLNTNGTLYRYSINGTTGPVSAAGSALGYKSFKQITVIAENPSYDTLLATTKTGALYTITLPITRTLKGTLAAVRTTGFAQYHQIVAERCGNNGGTLLTGFDNVKNTATVYALSRAKGAATVVNTIGSVALPQDATTHFRYSNAQLIGQ